jgi:hypothetical protein
LLLFVKKKKRALRRPAEASLATEKPITIITHLVIARRHDEAISFADSSMEIGFSR